MIEEKVCPITTTSLKKLKLASLVRNVIPSVAVLARLATCAEKAIELFFQVADESTTGSEERHTPASCLFNMVPGPLISLPLMPPTPTPLASLLQCAVPEHSSLLPHPFLSPRPPQDLDTKD